MSFGCRAVVMGSLTGRPKNKDGGARKKKREIKIAWSLSFCF